VGTEEPVPVFAEWAGERRRVHFAESTVSRADPGGIELLEIDAGMAGVALKKSVCAFGTRGTAAWSAISSEEFV